MHGLMRRKEREKMRQRKLVVVVIMVLMILVFFTGCANKDNQNKAEARETQETEETQKIEEEREEEQQIEETETEELAEEEMKKLYDQECREEEPLLTDGESFTIEPVFWNELGLTEYFARKKLDATWEEYIREFSEKSSGLEEKGGKYVLLMSEYGEISNSIDDYTEEISQREKITEMYGYEINDSGYFRPYDQSRYIWEQFLEKNEKVLRLDALSREIDLKRGNDNAVFTYKQKCIYVNYYHIQAWACSFLGQFYYKDDFSQESTQKVLNWAERELNSIYELYME